MRNQNPRRSEDVLPKMMMMIMRMLLFPKKPRVGPRRLPPKRMTVKSTR